MKPDGNLNSYKERQSARNNKDKMKVNTKTFLLMLNHFKNIKDCPKCKSSYNMFWNFYNMEK